MIKMTGNTRGFISMRKKQISKWPRRVVKYYVKRLGNFAERQAISNMRNRTYVGSRNTALTGRALRSHKQYVRNGGMEREIVSNPQLSGASFNYSHTLDQGRDEVVAKRKKVLAVPVNKFGGVYHNYQSKKLPKLSKNGRFVILGKRVKATKGTRFFTDMIDQTKRKSQTIQRDVFKRNKL